MARPSKPWFRSANSTWYVKIAGKQVPLAKAEDEDDKQAKAEAEQRWHELMLAKQTLTAGDRNAAIAILDAYVTWVKHHRAPNTYRLHKDVLQSFCSLHGRVSISELRQFHVEQWCTAMEQPRWSEKKKRWVRWTDGTRRIAISTLITALNWAKKQGLISINPVAGMEKPAAKSRGKECLISPEEYKQIVVDTDRPFREFLFALAETGARPGEVASVTAKDFQPESGAWVLDKHKTARKTGKPRVIYLTDAMVDLTKRLAAERPEGPLFRNSQGKPWVKVAWVARFLRIRERLKLSARACAYSMRHVFSTDWLIKNGSVTVLQELLGHTSTQMIMRHYSHIGENRSALRNELQRLKGAAPEKQ